MANIVCDFCTAGEPAIAYLVGDFEVVFQAPDPEVGATYHNTAGAWCACRVCRVLIEADRLNDLVLRIVHFMRTRYTRMTDAEGAVMRHRQRQLMSRVLRMRSEPHELDEPAIQALKIPDDRPFIGGRYRQRGNIVEIEMAPRVGRHPDAP